MGLVERCGLLLAQRALARASHLAVVEMREKSQVNHPRTP
jgi:hypothetical protein